MSILSFNFAVNFFLTEAEASQHILLWLITLILARDSQAS
jgi:hypothetical protein